MDWTNRSKGRIAAPVAVMLFGLLVTAAALLLLLPNPEEEGPGAGGRKGSPAIRVLDRPAGAPAEQDGRPGASSTALEQYDPSSSADLEEDLKEPVPSALLGAVVRGRVKDEEDKPIPGVEVVLVSRVPEGLDPLLPINGYTRKTATNQEGRFQVPVPREGIFQVQLHKKGFAPEKVAVALPGDDLEIRLTTGVSLTGQIVEKESKIPLPGALVRIRSPYPGEPVEADDRGIFTLPDLREGPTDVECFMPGYDVKHVGDLFVHAEGANFVDIALEPGAPLDGRVLEAGADVPVANARVVYAIGFKGAEGIHEVQHEETRTDREGFFHFEPVSRKGYRLRVAAPGYAPVLLKPFKEQGKPRALLKVRLKKEGAVAGRVLDPAGSPLAGAKVRAFVQDLWEKKEVQARSDRDGRFSLAPLPPGRIILYASHPDFAPAAAPDLILHDGEVLEGVEIALPLPGRIRGDVIGPDGLPVADARVVIDGMRPILSRLYGVFPITYTDTRGTFTVSHLPEGTYRVSASLEGRRSPVEEVVLAPGGEVPVSLTLVEGLVVQGRVTDPAGAPLDDVLVTGFAGTGEEGHAPVRTRKRKPIQQRLDKHRSRPGQATAQTPYRLEQELFHRRRLNRFRGMTRTTEDGGFFLDGFLPDDRAMLRFWKPGYTGRTVANLVPGGGAVTVALSPMGAVEGMVRDEATNMPLHEFGVTLHPSGPDPRPARERKNNRFGARAAPGREQFFRSEDGTFRLDGVRPGNYLLRVLAKGYQPGKPLPLQVSPEIPVPFVNVFLAQSGTLQVRVQGGDRGPVAGITVYCHPAAKAPPTPAGKGKNKGGKGKRGASKGKRTKPVVPPRKGVRKGRTDEKGRCRFLGLAPGAYTVIVGNPAHPLVPTKTVGVDAGTHKGTGFFLPDLGALELSVKDDAGLSLRALATLTGGSGALIRSRPTDKVGSISFRNLPAGRYKVRLECKGFLSRTLNVNIKENQRMKQDVTLKRKPSRR